MVAVLGEILCRGSTSASCAVVVMVSGTSDRPRDFAIGFDSTSSGGRQQLPDDGHSNSCTLKVIEAVMRLNDENDTSRLRTGKRC